MITGPGWSACTAGLWQTGQKAGASLAGVHALPFPSRLNMDKYR